MMISGFTLVRNATRLEYPIVESIRSILPIVDEFVVNVGDSDDGTLKLVRSIGSSKLRIVESKWNPNLTTGGYILAQQTNIALFNCTGEWAIYLQADEAIHERDHERLVELMGKYRADNAVEGLLLQRLMFYGDYRTIVVAHPFSHDLACRIVKPHRFVLSRGDAAGFTVHPKYKSHGRRIRAVDTGLTVFHYGDVRPPSVSLEFQSEKSNFWSENSGEPNNDYYSRVPRRFVAEYRGSHPVSMRERIMKCALQIDLNSPRWRRDLTRPERRRYWRSRLIEIAGRRDVIPVLNNSYKLVGSHRERYIGGELDV
jgi:glycosyltransferase involved in cell wall biosynthesis